MSAPQEPLHKCKFCSKELDKNVEVCTSCGYDPKTDTCLPQEELKKERKKKGPSPYEVKRRIALAVKTLLLAGIVLLIVSYKDQLVVSFKNLPDILNSMASGKKIDKAGVKMTAAPQESFAKKVGDKINEGRKKLFFEVEGICFVKDAKSYIVANGEILAEGDTLKGVTVRKIGKSTVTVEADGKAKELGVSQGVPFPAQKAQ